MENSSKLVYCLKKTSKNRNLCLNSPFIWVFFLRLFGFPDWLSKTGHSNNFTPRCLTNLRKVNESSHSKNGKPTLPHFDLWLNRRGSRCPSCLSASRRSTWPSTARLICLINRHSKCWRQAVVYLLLCYHSLLTTEVISAIESVNSGWLEGIFFIPSPLIIILNQGDKTVGFRAFDPVVQDLIFGIEWGWAWNTCSDARWLKCRILGIALMG